MLGGCFGVAGRGPTALGRFGAAFRRSWTLVGRSWAPLGVLVGHSWSFWVFVGCSWSFL